MGLLPVFNVIGNGSGPNRLGTFSFPSTAKTPSLNPISKTARNEANQHISFAADAGMTADKEDAQHMHKQGLSPDAGTINHIASR